MRARYRELVQHAHSYFPSLPVLTKLQRFRNLQATKNPSNSIFMTGIRALCL